MFCNIKKVVLFLKLVTSLLLVRNYGNIIYYHLAIKLCSEFFMPIINITKKEHIKEYNEHIKDIIDNLESINDIYSICSYLMNICCKEYFKLNLKMNI